LADNPNSKFVVLDYNSQDDLLPFLGTFEREIADGRLTVFSYRGWPVFRVAHAKNLVHRLGIHEGADILVNLDADNFAGDRFEDFALEQFARDPRAFLWARMIKGELTRGIAGRIAVSNRGFLSVGGYNEAKFNEWGSDDKDFSLRLGMAGYVGFEIDPKFLSSVKHNDKVRFKEYPHLHGKCYTDFVVNETTTVSAVVNEGKIGCGTVFRNFDRDDLVEIKPVPTRVFGIGLSKTATTSLCAAFRTLGYEAWHWNSAHTAKAIWREMSEGNRSPTLERYEMLCDLPIPVLYKKLDEVYPGSKFVLTIRNEKKWLDSIKRHFDYRCNKWRAGWDLDPFTHRIHQIIYGQTHFDETVFLDRYRAHNAEVQEYFKHRTESLLVLHIDKGHGWAKLCSFLGKPTPGAPFPHENPTR
jgi:hypothetical protein